MQQIVDQGNDMGVYLFTMLGGEPFMWDELLDFARQTRTPTSRCSPTARCSTTT